jgi:hypothetical protein
VIQGGRNNFASGKARNHCQLPPKNAQTLISVSKKEPFVLRSDAFGFPKING